MSSPPVSPAMVAYARGIAEPRLSPNGREVAYVTTVNRRAALAVVPARGGPEETVTSDLVPRGQGGYGGGAFAWVADGRALVVAAGRRPVGWCRATAVRPGGSPSTATRGGWAHPRWRPTGPGSPTRATCGDVAVVSLADDGAWPVRLSGGADFAADPAWSCDGARVLWQTWDVPAMPWDESRIVSRRSDGTGPIELVHGAPDSQSLQAQPSPVDPATRRCSPMVRDG